jgi:serine/threonine protein kinase
VECALEAFAEKIRKLDADAQAHSYPSSYTNFANIRTISDGSSLISVTATVDTGLVAATSRFPSQSSLIQLFDQLALGWYESAHLASAGLLPAPLAAASHNNVHMHERSIATPLLGIDGEDFLYRLLQWNPAERLTSAEAMRHPFIARDDGDE